MPVRKVNGFTLWDLWFFCTGSHVFVRPEDSDLPWEYDGGPEGHELLISNIRAKHFQNYGEVIEVSVYRREDD